MLGGRFVEPGRILNICSLVLRDPQQIVVWGLPTYYPLWLGGLWRLRSRIDCRVRIRTAIEALDVRWTVLCCAKHSHPGPRPPMSDVTRILSQIEQGDAQAAEKLLPLVYDELRKLAAAKLAQEKPGQTLQATALVHEAYLRLVGEGSGFGVLGSESARGRETGDRGQKWNSRGHFFGAAAEAMRRVLVEQARSKNSAKRGGDRQRCDLVDMTTCPNPRIDDLLDLDDALTKLTKMAPAAARLVELRVFAGMAVEDAAQLLGVSPRTAKRTWAYARAWLRREAGLEDSPNS